ncbi:MAG: type II secretion system protein [Myxococcota bacterium]|jgi:prepilin-type N-terminal cleavage/methylation domain-containing protein|nr:type II secretion system protein [Myxococcota bacterium]
MRSLLSSRHCIRSRSGFTLLELMMAIFILAVAATILLGTQSTSLRLMGYSNNLAVAGMLARGKMQDIEYEVLSEGFTQNFEQTMSGDFSDEGYDEITWNAVIEAIEIGDDASNDFVAAINEQLYGAGEETGSLSGNLAFSQFLPLMVSYLPNMINQLGQRIRRLTLTIEWEYLGKEQSLTLSQYIVQLELPEEVQQEPLTP